MHTEPRRTFVRADTQTVTIDVPHTDVFAFLADPEHLPLWAVGFCRTIRRDVLPDHWLVATGQGEVPMRYVVEPSSGTIDFHFSPAPGVDMVAYSRVVPNGDGAEYVFTQFQSSDMRDDVFEGQVRALTGELAVLRGLLHARASCRV